MCSGDNAIQSPRLFKNNRDRLRDSLKFYAQTAGELSYKMGVPTSSIRRMVGELRAEGVAVKTGPFGYSYSL